VSTSITKLTTMRVETLEKAPIARSGSRGVRQANGFLTIDLPDNALELRRE